MLSRKQLATYVLAARRGQPLGKMTKVVERPPGPRRRCSPPHARASSWCTTSACASPIPPPRPRAPAAPPPVPLPYQRERLYTVRLYTERLALSPPPTRSPSAAPTPLLPLPRTPPPSRTKWTRLVHPSVPTGHDSPRLTDTPPPCQVPCAGARRRALGARAPPRAPGVTPAAARRRRAPPCGGAARRRGGDGGGCRCWGRAARTRGEGAAAAA